MTSENKILIEFLNNRFDQSDLSVMTPENWSRFVSEAGRQRVAPLLYHKIKQAGAESMIPEAVVRKLKNQYLANACRNTVLFHQLEVMVSRLNDNHIPVMLLKGAHLAEFVYKDIALRPMSDIDILVKKDDLSDVVKIAFSEGYRFFYDRQRADKKTGERYCYEILTHYKHFQPLIHPESGCLLEIHCYISEVGSPFDIPVSDLWDDAVPAVLNKNSVWLLSPENLIINLCLHTAYGHLYGYGVGMLYDVLAAMEHYGDNIDWQKLCHRSSLWGTNHCVYLTCYLIKKWFGRAAVPETVFEDLNIDEMARIAEKKFFSSSDAEPLHRHFINWRNLNGIKKKLHYIKGVLFPSREFMANRYIQPKSSRVVLVSYFLRFCQAVQGALGILKSLLQDRDYTARLNQGDTDFQLREWLSKS